MSDQLPQKQKPWLDVGDAHLGHACCLLANVIYGGWNIGARFAAKNTDPILFQSIRTMLTGLVGIGFAYQLGGMKARHKPRLALLGLTVCVVQVLFILGAVWTDAHTCAALQAVSPVLGFTFPMILRMEEPSIARLASGLLACVGVTLLTGARMAASDQPQYRMGVFALLSEQVLLALFPILQKPLVDSYNPLCLTGLGLSYAGLLSVFVCFFYCALLSAGAPPLHGGEASTAVFGTIRWASGPGLHVLLAAVVVVTLGGMTLRTVGVRTLPTSTVVLYSATQPIWGAFFACLLLGESVGPRAVAGIICIVAALVCTLQPSEPQDKRMVMGWSWGRARKDTENYQYSRLSTSF